MTDYLLGAEDFDTLTTEGGDDTVTFTERRPAGDVDLSWGAVASDADGSNLIAADYGGRVWTSSNSGAAWTERRPAGDADKNWYAVASDSDGSVLLAGVYEGRLYLSVNAGVDWSEVRPAGDADKGWYAVSSDEDGSVLIAGTTGLNGGRLYLSVDSGTNWTEARPVGDTDQYWQSVSSDNDGSVLLAAVYGARLYLSIDTGTNWTEVQPAGAANKNWYGIAVDSDGSNLAACVYGGRVYTSSDGGSTWVERQPAGNANKNWRGLASDKDGSVLVAAISEGRLYTSNDGGATWTERQPAGDADGDWRSLASDSDGSNLFFADFGGRLWTCIVDGYELLLFSSGAELAYRLNIDWDGDGIVDDDSDAFYMLRYAIDRGRDTIIEPSGGGFTPQEIGKLYITLDNTDGRYDPWNTSSPLYPNVKPGKLLKFKVNYLSSSDYSDDDLFTAFISDIQMNGRRDTVNIVAEDMWRLFSEGKWFKRTYRPIYAYTHINNLLTDLNYTYGSTVSTDDNAIGFSRYAWSDNLSPKKEIENVTDGTLGRAFITGDGIFHYKALTTTDAIELTITNDEVLKDIFLPTPWANTRDKIVLKARNIETGVPVNSTKGILSNNTPILVPGNATEDRWINYSLTTTDELANGSVYGLWEMFSFSANSAKDGSSNDMTSDFSVVTNYNNFNVNLHITNGSSDAGYLYNYRVYGQTTDGTTYVTSDDSSTDPRNTQFLYVTDYDKEFLNTNGSDNTFVLESPHLSVGKALDNAYASYFASSVTPFLVGSQGDLDRLDDIGNTLLNYLKTPQAYPTIQMQGRYPDQLQLDIEDAIQLTLTALGIDDTYRVHKITHEASGTCQDVLSTFKLYPIMSRST